MEVTQDSMDRLKITKAHYLEVTGTTSVEDAESVMVSLAMQREREERRLSGDARDVALSIISGEREVETAADQAALDAYLELYGKWTARDFHQAADEDKRAVAQIKAKQAYDDAKLRCMAEAGLWPPKS